jgi:hypothetical protein
VLPQQWQVLKAVKHAHVSTVGGVSARRRGCTLLGFGCRWGLKWGRQRSGGRLACGGHNSGLGTQEDTQLLSWNTKDVSTFAKDVLDALGERSHRVGHELRPLGAQQVSKVATSNEFSTAAIQKALDDVDEARLIIDGLDAHDADVVRVAVPNPAVVEDSLQCLLLPDAVLRAPVWISLSQTLAECGELKQQALSRHWPDHTANESSEVAVGHGGVGRGYRGWAGWRGGVAGLVGQTLN